MKTKLPEKLLSSPARRVWEHFYALSAIPRPPGGEEGVREHLRATAADAGWESVEDEVGNIVLRVPGRGSLAGEDVLILQSHMDMVCEKTPEKVHDFSRDPLQLAIDGEWVTAEGTTLGADNGIGMALALAAADADVPERIPLELLFTVDEETGLTGASNLDASMLQGRRLINLDSETEGVFIASCAGGRAVTATFARNPSAPSPPSKGPAVRCTLGGLRGGHSGVDINDNRVNAVVAAAGILNTLRTENGDCLLLSFEGGTKFNVIPRDAEFTTCNSDEKTVRAVVSAAADELRRTEQDVTFSVETCEAGSFRPLPWNIVDFIDDLPKGVIAMDSDIEGLVETSSNLGVLKSDGLRATFLVKIRSADDSLRDAECEKAAAIAVRHGGAAETGEAYPGWASSADSELVHHLRLVFERIFGRRPRIEGIHAGLEAGVIGAMLGTAELASLGPTIESPHSPGERLLIESVAPVQQLLETFVGSSF